MPKKRTIYRLSCYGENAYVFSVPLRASGAWVKRVLGRKYPVKGVPLGRNEFGVLRPRIPDGVEVGWTDTLQYYLESTTVGAPDER